VIDVKGRANAHQFLIFFTVAAYRLRLTLFARKTSFASRCKLSTPAAGIDREGGRDFTGGFNENRALAQAVSLDGIGWSIGGWSSRRGLEALAGE
jgi:hypothetical protein